MLSGNEQLGAAEMQLREGHRNRSLKFGLSEIPILRRKVARPPGQ